MNLRERKSSSSDVNKLFKEDQIKGSKIKVLGLLWDTVKNTMAITTEKFNGLMLATTKRQVQTSVACLFDTLG